jgi:16S rRNA (guanine1207-N2)-methyltransferase
MHAFDALSHVLETNPDLGAQGRVLFLRAQPGSCLERFQGRLTCEQPWKPRAAALEAAGFKVTRESQGPFETILLLPERQRESILGDIARAHDLLAQDGKLIVALHNDWGAKRTEQQLAEVAREVCTVSKHHSRVFWAVKNQPWEAARLKSWQEAAAMRRVLDGRFWSVPGLFHWDEIDAGSRLLTEHLPATLSGAAADLGAGWGFLSDHLLRSCPNLRSLDCFEADAAALECLRRNLGNVPTPIRPRIVWSDVTSGLGGQKYDVIVMNPPFHDGRDADPLLGIKFITTAASSLRTGGELWLVANKHLPYETMMRDCFEHYRTVVEAAGFKVLHGARPQAHVQRHSSTRARRPS